MIKWTEISTQPSLWRYEALSEELRQCGVENKFSPTHISSVEEFNQALLEAQQNFQQIRLGGELAEVALTDGRNLPAVLLRLKAADAFVPEFDRWWPRCFYFEGIKRTLVQDLKGLELKGGVFVMGGTWEARVVIMALTRVGFHKVLISDVDEARGERLVEQLDKIDFGVTFQFVTRSMVTQLPGTSTVGVNVLSLVEHPDLVTELSYLNFLRPNGVWIETHPYNEESPISTEALSLGTQVEPALHLLSNVDLVWVEKCFKVKIDLLRYRQALEQSLKKRR